MRSTATAAECLIKAQNFAQRPIFEHSVSGVDNLPSHEFKIMCDTLLFLLFVSSMQSMKVDTKPRLSLLSLF